MTFGVGMLVRYVKWHHWIWNQLIGHHLIIIKLPAIFPNLSLGHPKSMNKLTLNQPAIKKFCTLVWLLQEISDTLDKEAVYRCMGNCYEMSQPERPKVDMASIKTGGEGMNIGMTLRSAKNLAKIGTQMLASKLVSLEGIKVGAHRNLKVFTSGPSSRSIFSCSYSFQGKIAKIIAYQPHPTPLWKLPSLRGENLDMLLRLRFKQMGSISFRGFPLRLENLEKWEGIFQSGKSQGILNRLEKSGKITQNTGKLWEFEINIIWYF